MICFHWACQRNQHIIECLVHALKKWQQLKLSPIFTVRYQFSSWADSVRERERVCVYSESQKSTATHNYHHNHYPSLMRAIKKRHSPFIKGKCHCCNFDIIPSFLRLRQFTRSHSTNRMSNGDSTIHRRAKRRARRKKRSAGAEYMLINV